MSSNICKQTCIHIRMYVFRSIYLDMYICKPSSFPVLDRCIYLKKQELYFSVSGSCPFIKTLKITSLVWSLYCSQSNKSSLTKQMLKILLIERAFWAYKLDTICPLVVVGYYFYMHTQIYTYTHTHTHTHIYTYYIYKLGYFIQVLITTNLFRIVSGAYHTHQAIFASENQTRKSPDECGKLRLLYETNLS